MKKFKRTLSMLLVVLLLFSTMSMGVTATNSSTNSTGSAATSTTNAAPFSIDISTDKGSYKATDIAKINVKVTNTSNTAIENVSAEALFDGLSPVGRGNTLKKETNKLNAGESLSFSYSAMINSDYKGLNIFQKIILFFKKLFNRTVSVGDNGFNNGRTYAQAVETISFGKFDTKNTVRVWYGKNENSNDNYVEFSNFQKNPFNADVGEITDVTFSINITSNAKIENNEVDLYVDNVVVGRLNDNGTNGDTIANDGTFSGTVSLYSDKRKDVDCYVKYGNYISDKENLYYYKAPTIDEETQTSEIQSDIKEIIEHYNITSGSAQESEIYEKCYSEIEQYLNNRPDIKEYSSVPGTLIFSISLHNGLWIGAGTNFTNKNKSVDKNNYSRKKIKKTPESTTQTYEIETLQPCYADLTTSVFDNIAKNIAMSTKNYNYSLSLKDGDVTIEVLKNFAWFRVVILDGHGGVENSKYFMQLSERPTIDKNKKYLASDDLSRTVADAGDCYLVSEEFFDKYYKTGDLSNAIIYIGTCFGGNDEVGIRNILAKKGAQAIFSFKNTVISQYNRDMCETIFEQMSNGKSAKEAVNKAKKKNGMLDPYSDENPAQLILTGNNIECTLVSPVTSNKSIRGQAIDSQTNKPIANAQVICGLHECYTNKNGEFKLPISTNQQQFTIEVIHNNYNTIKRTIAGYNGSYETIKMTPKGSTGDTGNSTVFGTVKDNNTNKPIYGVTVSLHVSGTIEPLAWYYTDNVGSFQLDLPVGKYLIRFYHEKYQGSNISFVVDGSNSIYLEPVFLIPKNGTFTGDPGTETNPYLISTISDLKNIPNNATAYYKMTNDINMSEATWTPKVFKGHFNGNGYSIKNLNYTAGSNNEWGFFSTNSGEVKNLIVENIKITYDKMGSYYTDPEFKYVGAIAAINEGTIDNCTIKSGLIQTKRLTNGLASGYGYAFGIYAGGIAGYNKGVIKDCINSATLNIASTYSSYVCGIAGYNNGNVQHCLNTGNINCETTVGSYKGNALIKVKCAGISCTSLTGASAPIISNCTNAADSIQATANHNPNFNDEQFDVYTYHIGNGNKTGSNYSLKTATCAYTINYPSYTGAGSFNVTFESNVTMTDLQSIKRLWSQYSF